MQKLLLLTLVTLSAVGLASKPGSLFEAVTEVVREKRGLQPVFSQLGDPVEIERLKGGVDRYHFDLKGRGVYVPGKGRWIGAVIDVKDGKCQGWEPVLIYNSIATASGKCLGTLPDVNPLRPEDWKIADVLRDFTLSAKLEDLTEEDRQFLIEYVKGWFALAGKRREDPSLPVEADFAKLVFALSKAEKNLSQSNRRTVRLSELSGMLK